MLSLLCCIMVRAAIAGMVYVASNTQINLLNAVFLSYSEVLLIKFLNLLITSGGMDGPLVDQCNPRNLTSSAGPFMLSLLMVHPSFVRCAIKSATVLGNICLSFVIKRRSSTYEKIVTLLVLGMSLKPISMHYVL